MTSNEIADAARARIAGNPELEASMRSIWTTVVAAINAHIEKSDKRWTMYEAHHITQAARLEMLTEFVHGRTPEECAAAALCRAGIEAEGQPS